MFEYFKNLFKKQPKVVPHGNYATTESKQIRKDEILKTDFNAPSKTTAKVNIKQSLGRQVRPNTPDYIRNSVESDLGQQIRMADYLAFTAQQASYSDITDTVQAEEKKEPVMCKADYQFTVDEHKSHTSYSPSYSDSSSSSSSDSSSYSSSDSSSSSSCSSSSSSCD